MLEGRIDWTNESVLDFSGGADPIEKIEQKARQAVLDAVDQGWDGPPFDPIELAKILGIPVRPNAAVADARVFPAHCGYEIEYNPHRPRGRVNFSIAHEIAHTFFPDCADKVRSRSREGPAESDWQLEVLCNVGAAELTMPVGSFPSEEDAVVTIEELMRLRKAFQVSAEAVLIRLVKLASSSVACFSATRVPQADNTAEYRMDYRIGSSHWSEGFTRRSWRRFRSEVLDGCVAIGTTSKGSETWDANGPEVHVEAVALPPLPGTGNLRTAGFMRPAAEAPDLRGIEYRQGNAALFGSDANAAIVHIVNDRAQRWGPRGFARAVRAEHPSAYDDYAWWTAETPGDEDVGRRPHGGGGRRQPIRGQSDCSARLREIGRTAHPLRGVGHVATRGPGQARRSGRAAGTDAEDRHGSGGGKLGCHRGTDTGAVGVSGTRSPGDPAAPAMSAGTPE